MEVERGDLQGRHGWMLSMRMKRFCLSRRMHIAVSGEMEKENLEGIQLTWVHLEDGH